MLKKICPICSLICWKSVYINIGIFLSQKTPFIRFYISCWTHYSFKPNAVSKHHKSYKPSTHKKEVPKTQLTELLNQGIITPVNEKEDIPISTTIVLVSKKEKKKENLIQVNILPLRRNIYSLTDFIVISIFLNSQTKRFRYTIPNLALNTCFGTYTFLRLPMGLSTSPIVFRYSWTNFWVAWQTSLFCVT